ncbi:hypothetical protein [Paracoccus sp. AK26]|uniref:hypothetical protein n=1 Tax=Paracoccus sp. AK26 TaxID=2589076 RepID=UPI001430544C|nr:hypothetical protein [Paracoccus sp. AK26]
MTQQLVDQGRLAVVNVSNDGDVADIHGRPFQFAVALNNRGQKHQMKTGKRPLPADATENPATLGGGGVRDRMPVHRPWPMPAAGMRQPSVQVVLAKAKKGQDEQDDDDQADDVDDGIHGLSPLMIASEVRIFRTASS